MATLVGVCVTLLLLFAQVHDSPDAENRLFEHSIRVADPELRLLLERGYERSATLRELVSALDASRWLIFIQEGRCSEKVAVACLLHLVGEYEGSRYLRIVISRRDRHAHPLIATIAHELQHALEATQDSSVVDTVTLRALFKRIGYVNVRSNAGIAYETRAARQVGERVLRELARSPARRNR